MMGTYSAAFILPPNTKRLLTDMGWVFENDNYLPLNIIEFLRNNLNLKLDEKYLGIGSYCNDRFQALLTMDGSGNIEHVYIKIYGDNLDLLQFEFNRCVFDEAVELFIPSAIHE